MNDLLIQRDGGLRSSLTDLRGAVQIALIFRMFEKIGCTSLADEKVIKRYARVPVPARV